MNSSYPDFGSVHLDKECLKLLREFSKENFPSTFLESPTMSFRILRNYGLIELIAPGDSMFSKDESRYKITPRGNSYLRNLREKAIQVWLPFSLLFALSLATLIVTICK